MNSNIIQRKILICSIILSVFEIGYAQSLESGEKKLSFGLGTGIGIEMLQDSRMALGVHTSLKYLVSSKFSCVLRSHYFSHLKANTQMDEPTTRKFHPLTQWQVALGCETALIGILVPNTSRPWGLSWGVHAGYSLSHDKVESIDYSPMHPQYDYQVYFNKVHALVVSTGFTLYRKLKPGTIYLEALPQFNLHSKTNVNITDNTNSETRTDSYSDGEVEFSGVMVNVGYRWTW